MKYTIEYMAEGNSLPLIRVDEPITLDDLRFKEEPLDEITGKMFKRWQVTLADLTLPHVLGRDVTTRVGVSVENTIHLKRSDATRHQERQRALDELGKAVLNSDDYFARALEKMNTRLNDFVYQTNRETKSRMADYIQHTCDAEWLDDAAAKYGVLEKLCDLKTKQDDINKAIASFREALDKVLEERSAIETKVILDSIEEEGELGKVLAYELKADGVKRKYATPFGLGRRV